MKNIESQVTTIGIAGEGKMGTAIFNHFLDHGFTMRWLCSSRADLDKLRRQTARRVARRMDGVPDSGVAGSTLHSWQVSSSKDIFGDCQLVIEAIPEILEMKTNFFKEIDPVLSGSTIVTSNSSSFLPSVLNPITTRKARFCGLHFFYPLEFKRFAEVIPGPDTDAAIPGILEDLLQQTGMTGLVLCEANSFIMNRIMLDVQAEAWNLVSSGRCTAAQLDAWVSKSLFPSGIFSVMDQVGLDTMLSATTEYVKNYRDKDQYQPLIIELHRLVESGRTGKKDGPGFYPEPTENDGLAEPDPEAKAEILRFIHHTWLSSCKRAAMSTRIPIPDLNSAICDYFDLEKGPFE